MNFNKALTIIVVAFLAASTIKYVFGGTPVTEETSDDFFDSEDTKIQREKERTLREKDRTLRVQEQEKTKQLHYQFKIDSIKSLKK